MYEKKNTYLIDSVIMNRMFLFLFLFSGKSGSYMKLTAHMTKSPCGYA